MPRLAAQKLTKALLEAPLPEGKRQVEIRDSEARGLVAYVFPSGTVTLVVVLAERGKRRRFPLGAWNAPLSAALVAKLGARRTGGPRAPDPRLTLDVARELAAIFRRDFEDGEDPLRDVQRSKALPRFDEFAKSFLDRAAKKRKPRTLVELRRHLSRASEAWAAMRIDKIAVEDVRALAAKVAADSARNPRATRQGVVEQTRFLAGLSALFQDAFREHDVANIVRRVERAKRPDPRERVPDGDEMSAILAACAGLREAGDVYGALGIEMLALTGARLREALSCLWKDLDLDEARPVWTIRAGVTKSGRQRRLPLPPGLRALLAATPHASVYVIAGRSGTKPRADLAGPWRRVLAAAGLTDSGLTLHDLRRAHGLALFEASGLDVAQRALGHSSPAVTAAVYTPSDDRFLRKPVEDLERKVLVYNAEAAARRRATK